MTFATQDADTLVSILGSRSGRTLRAVSGALRAEIPEGANLGTAFIGTGAALVCGIRAIYGFSWFIALWDAYPNPVPALLAWVVLILALVSAFIITRVVGDRLPDAHFAVFLALLALAIALDLNAVWGLHDIGRNATASLTAGMALLVVLTLRPPRDILFATGTIGAALAAAMLVNTPLDADNLAPQITSLAFTVLPVVIGVMVVIGFRRMVKVELDRALIQSTVSAPRFAVGMLASEELARLDLAAEELLDSVSTGRTALPLRPQTASVAASLATELRLHLIEGRRETWLYHAVTESEMLGRSVTLTDKGSLAGLLDANQRDGLLAAIWLLVSDKSTSSAVRTLLVQIGPIVAAGNHTPGQKIAVPIVITTTGVARNRVDQSTWNAMRRVGRYSDTIENSSLRVDIECLVSNPADL